MFVGFLVACLYCFMMLSYSSRHRHDQKLRLPSSVVMGDEMLEHNELILPALRIDDRNGMPLEPWYDMEATDWSAPPVIIDANRSVIARNIKASGFHLIFVAHASRSATTLLSRMLEARGDVLCYREPIILTRLALKHRTELVLSILEHLEAYANQRRCHIVIK